MTDRHPATESVRTLKDSAGVTYRVFPKGCKAKIGDLRCGRREGHHGSHEAAYGPWGTRTAVWKNWSGT